jgi:hypothetical protein
MQALIERCPSLALALLREISLRLREFNRQHVREVLQVNAWPLLADLPVRSCTI